MKGAFQMAKTLQSSLDRPTDSLEEKLEQMEHHIQERLDELGRYVCAFQDFEAAGLANGAQELAIKDAILEPINDLSHTVRDLSSTVRDLSTTIQSLVKQQAQFMGFAVDNGFVPSGPFLERFHNDHPQEKKSIASFATKNFFSKRSTPQRCFIQGSSLALHLTYAIDADPDVPDGTVIHTNSAVAHLPIVYGQSNGRVHIWPVTTKAFDAVCAAWEIPPGDPEKASEYLKSLFTRDKDALKMAFLMPIYVTPTEGIFYERHGAAAFADLLANAKDDVEVIVLATGNRVVPHKALLPSDRMFYPALRSRLADKTRKLTLVVSAPAAEQPPQAAELAQSFNTIYWESSTGWQQV